jgi:hypothetical protein
MSCHRHINCVLQIPDAYIFLVTDISIVSYRHHMPTYFLSQTHQLCLTDITRLHMSSHRHINCVLQTLHACICLFGDTSIVSYRHDTPTYVLSHTLQLCHTDITRLHISCHRHIKCVYRYHTPTYVLSQTYQLCLTDITRLHMSCHRHSNCVLQTLHIYICLLMDTSVVSYRHHTPTNILSQTLQLCLTDITRLHMSCHRHIHCVL